MNRELMWKVAESIRTEEEIGYAQGNWFDYEDRNDDGSYCGTTACVAGHAIFLTGGLRRLVDLDLEMRVSSAAQKELELTPEQASALFAGTVQPYIMRVVFNVPEEHKDKIGHRFGEQGKVWMARVLETIAEHGS